MSRFLPLSLSLVLSACQSPPTSSEPSAEVRYSASRAPCALRSGLRNLYFGDLHVHSRLSWDAYAYDTRATPEEVYAFARGEGAVRLTPLAADGRGSREVRLARPLDFAALTDHAEFLGEVELCTTPGSPAYDRYPCVAFREGGEKAVTPWGTRLILPDGNSRNEDLCGAGAADCRSAAAAVWTRIRQATEAADDKSSACRFVAFPAYEYTASPAVTNLHRNVIFRNESVPSLPVTYFDQPKPHGLFGELAKQCLDAKLGCEAIVIPHNANWSNGTLFPGSLGADPEAERAEAALRARLEPVGEFMQHKGDSECSNGLGDPTEPACDFEKIRRPPFEDCGEGSGYGGVQGQGCVSRRDFLRGALLQGLVTEARLGVNPYRLGVIGSTDSHNGTPGLVEERGFPGHVGHVDDTAAKRLGEGTVTHSGLPWNNAGGLAAVWAVERSRDAIFEAFLRRETYATSGPRIAVRFFGGFGYAEAGLCSASDLPARGYSGGVPMGGLLRRSGASGAPRFILEAQRDPGVAGQPGTPLQSAQIIKGWLDADGKPRFKVYEVAGDPTSGTGVDLATCAPGGGGADRLCAEWSDPAFDPAQRAFYYARVLENPSCRWSTWDCLSLPAAARPPLCNDPALPKTVQERAITSPIWYSPES